MNVDDVVEGVGTAGSTFWKAYKIFFITYGSICGVMTLARLAYALGGIDYDPMEEFWDYLVTKMGKKGTPENKKPYEIKIISRRRL